jgi:uncharacterized protein YkwD
MARSISGFLAAVLCLLAALGATAQGKSSHTNSKARCTSARGKAHPRTSSVRKVHCPKGGRRRHRSRHPAHLLFFTAKDGHCPDATLAPSAANLPEVRAATLCLVNRERAAHGEAALHWNGSLVQAAQGHTESMAFGNYFEHVGPHGETPVSRMRRTGYIYSARLGYEIAENIGWGSLWLGTPKAVVATWMGSAGHRANILDRHFRDTGIGISSHVAGLAHGQSGGIYTQDFGVIVG